MTHGYISFDQSNQSPIGGAACNLYIPAYIGLSQMLRILSKQTRDCWKELSKPMRKCGGCTIGGSTAYQPIRHLQVLDR